MATEIHKFDGSAWLAITEIQYTDDTLTDRDLIEVYYNDASTWRQVFGASVTAQTLAWAASSPSDDYDALGTEGFSSFVQFIADVSGNFTFSFDEFESVGSTGDPIFGTYKPVPEVDAGNYEIAITFSGGTVSAVGSGTVINGTFQTLNISRGIKLSQSGTGVTNSAVTVEIREILTPANTTGVASFNMQALVVG